MSTGTNRRLISQWIFGSCLLTAAIALALVRLNPAPRGSAPVGKAGFVEPHMQRRVTASLAGDAGPAGGTGGAHTLFEQPFADFHSRILLIDREVSLPLREAYYRTAIASADPDEISEVFAWYNELNPGRKRFVLIDAIISKSVSSAKFLELDQWIAALDFAEERREVDSALRLAFDDERQAELGSCLELSELSSYLRFKAMESIVRVDPRLNGREFREIWELPRFPRKEFLWFYVEGVLAGNGGSVDHAWNLSGALPTSDRAEIGVALLRAGQIPDGLMETDLEGLLRDLRSSDTERHAE